MIKKLGVYLLSYKRPEYITQAIESILNQNDSNFDLIISENSGDNSVYPQILKYESDSRVKIIKHNTSLTSLDHFNFLIEEASQNYTYFMLFHDDDVMKNNCLSSLLEKIESFPNATAVSCNAEIINGIEHTDKIFNPYLKNETIIHNKSELINRYLTPQLSHPPFPAYLYRSSLIQNSRMNKQEGGKHSDVSFLVSLIEKGLFIWIAEPLLLYRQHQNNDSATIDLDHVFKLSKYFTQQSPKLFLKILLFYFKNLMKKILRSIKNHKILIVFTFAILKLIVYFIFLIRFLISTETVSEIKDIMNQKYFMNSLLTEDSILSNNMMEASPFILNEKLYYILSERDPILQNNYYINIYDYDTKKKIKNIDSDLGLGSVLSYNDKIYVVGTRNWFDYGVSTLILYIYDKNFNLISKNEIFKAHNDEKLFNTSIAFNENDNTFIISYEYAIKNTNISSQINFLTSKNLVDWKVMKTFKSLDYTACPTIKIIDKYIYLIYLGTNKNRALTYQTMISRSKDLINWTDSNYIFLSPDLNHDINASDVDFITYNSNTLIFYSESDQKTYAKVKIKKTTLPLDQILVKFFEKHKQNESIGMPSSLIFNLLKKQIISFNILMKDNILSSLKKLSEKYFRSVNLLKTINKQ